MSLKSVAVDQLTGRLEHATLALCGRLITLCEGSDAIAVQLQDKYLAAVSDIERVSIEALDADQGAFVVSDGLLQINHEPVARLLYAALDDIKRSAGAGVDLASEDVPELLERVLMQYVLHELRHRTQGVERFSTVNQLKRLADTEVMAELDVLADRDATFAYAAVISAGGSRADFLEAFREGLFLFNAYFFRVFPPAATRPDKIARAIGVLLMAARLANIESFDGVVERKDLPLDAPLIAKLTTDQTQLAVFRAEPSQLFLASANDDEVKQLVRCVCAGRFDDALDHACSLVRKLRL